jgi:hypothetical protein
MRDGHLYSDKTPGQPVLGVPFYAMHRAVGGESGHRPAGAMEPRGLVGDLLDCSGAHRAARAAPRHLRPACRARVRDHPGARDRLRDAAAADGGQQFAHTTVSAPRRCRCATAGVRRAARPGAERPCCGIERAHGVHRVPSSRGGRRRCSRPLAAGHRLVHRRGGPSARSAARLPRCRLRRAVRVQLQVLEVRHRGRRRRLGRPPEPRGLRTGALGDRGLLLLTPVVGWPSSAWSCSPDRARARPEALVALSLLLSTSVSRLRGATRPGATLPARAMSAPALPLLAIGLSHIWDRASRMAAGVDGGLGRQHDDRSDGRPVRPPRRHRCAPLGDESHDLELMPTLLSRSSAGWERSWCSLVSAALVVAAIRADSACRTPDRDAALGG